MIENLVWFTQDTHNYMYRSYVDDILVEENFWIDDEISYSIVLDEFREYNIRVIVVDIEMNSASLITIINYQLEASINPPIDDNPVSRGETTLIFVLVATILFFGTFFLRVRIKKLKFR